jgi:hypothetical protein
LSEIQGQRIDFSLGPKQISSTQVNQLIEAEVEKKIKERLIKDEIEADVKKDYFKMMSQKTTTKDSRLSTKNVVWRDSRKLTNR